MLEGLYGETQPIIEREPPGRRRALRHTRVTPRPYLDHASSAPLRPAALEAMLPFLARPSRRSRAPARGRARDSRRARGRAEQVAAFFGARPREVVFTSSGTEAVNAAIWGGLRTRAVAVTSSRLPSSTRACATRSNGPASTCTVVGVDRLGRFDAAAVVDAVRADTALVSVQLANHEVGTLQPAAEVCAALRERAACSCTSTRARRPVTSPFDSPRSAPTSVRSPRTSSADRRARARCSCGAACASPPLLVGGAQERARRGGIENVPAWVGFGAACADVDVAAEAGRQRDAHRRARRRSSTRSPASYGSSASATAVRSRTCCASVSKVSRPNRSCSRSTSTASRCTPVRRARRRCSNRRRCSRRWASTPTIRCGSRSAGRRPRPTSTGSWKCSRESSND